LAYRPLEGIGDAPKWKSIVMRKKDKKEFGKKLSLSGGGGVRAVKRNQRAIKTFNYNRTRGGVISIPACGRGWGGGDK